MVFDIEADAVTKTVYERNTIRYQDDLTKLRVKYLRIICFLEKQ